MSEVERQVFVSGMSAEVELSARGSTTRGLTTKFVVSMTSKRFESRRRRVSEETWRPDGESGINALATLELDVELSTWISWTQYLLVLEFLAQTALRRGSKT